MHDDWREAVRCYSCCESTVCAILAQVSVCLVDLISAFILCGYLTVELVVPWLGVRQAPEVRFLQYGAVCLHWLGMLVQAVLEEVSKILPQVPGLKHVSL